MNTERFEERLMHELKSYVHDRANDRDAAQSGAQADAAPRHGRRFTRPRTIAVGAGVAAVIAAAASVASFVGTTTVAGTAGGSPTPHRQLLHISNAAYEVQQQPAGIVKLTILDADKKPDVARLRSDLAKAGINAEVLPDLADCTHPLTHPSPDTTQLPPPGAAALRTGVEGGKFVFYLDPRMVVPGVTFVLMYEKNAPHEIGFAMADSNDVPNCFLTPAFH